MLTDEELAAFVSYMPKDLEDADVKIQQLLQHIADITPDCKVAYEVRSSSDWRTNDGTYWHKGTAEKEVQKVKALERNESRFRRSRVNICRVNVIKLNGKWHKFNTTPLNSIEGEIKTAEGSNLKHNRSIKNKRENDGTEIHSSK